eukprot:COSAG01_NODE_33215_length_568_cov_0.669510_2_plen_44_part_01
MLVRVQGEFHDTVVNDTDNLATGPVEHVEQPRDATASLAGVGAV